MLCPVCKLTEPTTFSGNILFVNFIYIKSGYRSYATQKYVFQRNARRYGTKKANTFSAKAGQSEHQTGLAIDICVYKDNKCYIEQELTYFDEISWLRRNSHRFGFVFRYTEEKEDITGYNYEPWHLRYVGNMASYLYYNNLVLEELF